jgi:hypothetical protein
MDARRQEYVHGVLQADSMSCKVPAVAASQKALHSAKPDPKLWKVLTVQNGTRSACEYENAGPHNASAGSRQSDMLTFT